MTDLSTREQILKAAQEMFCKHGQANATISEIAVRAGVTDSAIYHYFKNKEDLLFSIIGLYLQDVLRQLENHLAGILEPISRLSKMVWFHLHYNVTHPDYSRLLLFECRSNHNFYRHESYNLIRKYAGIMLEILEHGVTQGVFRENVDMHIVRDLILGALDLDTIPFLLGQESEVTSSKIQSFMEVVRAMIEISTTEPDTEADKSARILEAAEKMFSKKGYAQASVAEIARLANVAEGTVYEYFENKEDLLLNIPRIRFQEHMDSLREVFEIKTPLRKFRRFLRYHFLIYMDKPDFLRVYLLNVRLNQKFYESRAYSIFQDYTDIIGQILDEGKQDGTVRADVNCEVVKRLFFGGFAHMALRWLILDHRNRTDKTVEIDEVISLLERAVIARHK